MNDRVECRSENEYAQRPLAFYWTGQRLLVSEVLTEARTPLGKSFWVRTAELNSFELTYIEYLDQWHIQPISSKENA
jgi:hypothetical protein